MGWPEWFNWQTMVVTLGVMSLVAHLLKRVRRFVQQHGRQFIDAAFWLANRYATRRISAILSMRRYCRSQLSDESAKFLQVPGNQSAALEVDAVFVPLILELGGRQKRFSSATILSAGSRLIIAGDPGSGKTTLVKRILRESCRGAMVKPEKSKLPIRLELKSLEPPKDLDTDVAAGEWLLKQLRDAAVGVEGFEMNRLFDSHVRDLGLLALLDGLDEVSSERYPVIASGLRGLSRTLARMSNDNQIIITTRTQFIQQISKDLRVDYPQTLYLTPFTPNDIYLFLTRWPFEIASEKNIARIYQNLTDRPTLREMCTNPLVLAMYVQSDQEADSGDIPETRTEFYRKVVGELLVMRRRRQEIVVGRSVSLREQRESILGRLALDNLCDSKQSTNTHSWKKAVEFGSRIWDCSPSQAEKELRTLARETGIISEERPGETFRFIHLTFCEFLSAIECAHGLRNGWRTLLTRHRGYVSSGEPSLQARLVEVIPFTHALLPRVQRSEALRDVAELGDRLVLGRCFLETQLYDQEQWKKYLADEGEYFRRTTNVEWDEERLRRLHLFSVVVGDAQDWMHNIAKRAPETDLNEVFSAIVADDRQTMMTVFSSYVSQDAAAAFRLAERIGVDLLGEDPELLIESCQSAPFTALAIERVELDTVHAEQWVEIVTEAALRYAVVASNLYVNQADVEWIIPDGQRDPLIRRIFASAHLYPGSCYATFIEFLFSSKRPQIVVDARQYPAIQAATRAFSKTRLILSIYRLCRPLSLVLFISGLPSIVFGVTAESIWDGLSWAILAFLSWWVSFALMRYAMHFSELYQAIFNIRFVRPDPKPVFKRGGPLGRRLLRQQRRALAGLLRQRPGLGSRYDKMLLGVAPEAR